MSAPAEAGGSENSFQNRRFRNPFQKQSREFAVAEKAATAWFALRELHEGATPTFERLAAATGRTVETLRNRAKRESWGELAGGFDDADRRARLGRLTDWIIEILESVKKG